MARFYKIEDSWINLDSISLMNYDSDTNRTFIEFCGSEDWFEGDCIADILNANNDLTMHDKMVCRYMGDRFKSPLSLITAKFDALLKNMGKK